MRLTCSPILSLNRLACLHAWAVPPLTCLRVVWITKYCVFKGNKSTHILWSFIYFAGGVWQTMWISWFSFLMLFWFHVTVGFFTYWQSKVLIPFRSIPFHSIPSLACPVLSYYSIVSQLIPNYFIPRAWKSTGKKKEKERKH